MSACYCGRCGLPLSVAALAGVASLMVALASAPPAGDGDEHAATHDAPPVSSTNPTEAPADDAAQARAAGDPYLLATCAVSGKTLGEMGEPMIYDHEGREIRFCCPACAPKFQADPAKYLVEVDKQLVEQQTPFYPLETCLVSGEKLGGMGPAYDTIHNNRLVRFCCDGCVEEFKKDPAGYFLKLDNAVIEKQGANYPLKECVVSGHALGEMGPAVDVVIGHRLVRLCCDGCEEDLAAHPTKYLALLDAGTTDHEPVGEGGEHEKADDDAGDSDR